MPWLRGPLLLRPEASIYPHEHQGSRLKVAMPRALATKQGTFRIVDKEAVQYMAFPSVEHVVDRVCLGRTPSSFLELILRQSAP